MEEKCTDTFESVALNLIKTSRDSIPPEAAPIITSTSSTSGSSVKSVISTTKTTPSTSIIYSHTDISEHNSNYNDDKAVDCYKPAKSCGSMSLLQEEDFETNSQHAFAQVVLDDETTTSGVLEAYEISSSNLLPPSATHGDDDEVTSEHVAAVNDDNSSSTDAIQIIKVSSDSSTGSSSSNAFYNSSEVYVINDDDDDDDDDDDIDDEDEVRRSRIIANNNTKGVMADDDNEEEGDDNEDNMNITNQSSNTSAVRSSTTAKNNGVIMSTNGAMIFLETPVVEEQQHHHPMHHHHHHEMSATAKGANEFANDTNVIPKRLSDEFSKDAGDMGEETPSSSSATSNKNLQHQPKELIFDVRESRGCSENERMSSRLKKINLNQNTNCTNSQDQPSSSSKSSASRGGSASTNATSSSTGVSSLSDIESMDLIERRDFEHEQRLTGGIILKTSSFSKDDVLHLGMVKSRFMMKDNLSSHNSAGSDGNPHPSTSSNSRGFSSDSKCTYKDLSATPTSSRKLIVRLTKSTAKMNLSNTLSHHTEQQHQQTDLVKTSHNASINNEQKQHKSISPSSTSSAMPSSTSATASSSSSASAKTATITPSVIVEPGASAMGSSEIYSNSNSNDSLISRPSSTSSSVVNKQSHHLRQDKSHDEFSGPSTSTSATKGNVSSVVVRVFENGCSRTTAIQPLVNHSNHSSNSSTNDQQDDDVQPSTSSARCQYAPPPRSHRQVNASAQTNERYLSRNRSNSDATSSVVANDICLGAAAVGSNNAGPSSSRNNGSRRAEISQNIMNGLRMLNDNHNVESNFSFNHQNSAWNDCEDNNSDVEEICTCHQSSLDDGSSHGGSMSDLNDGVDEFDASQVYGSNAKDGGGDLSYNILQNLSISEDGTAASPECLVNRKRKYHDSRLMDHDYNSTTISGSGGSGNIGSVLESNSRKRIAYDFASTPRSSQSNNNATSTKVLASTPSSALVHTSVNGSPMGRRTPRSLIPTRDNPPPELQQWLQQFQRWSHAERLLAVDCLIEHCEPTQVRHMMKVIEPQFQRDFISLLPRELALQVLSYLDPQDLLRAAQTCRSWRFLCDDNLLWKEKCRQSQILTEPRTDRPKRGRAGNMPPIASPWKAAYMRQHIIEMNWRSRPIRQPKVLKGHDEHVITCLQFSGNRIVSGSDDNTLKVWSAVTGRCLRTLVGHTGGVWSSQMSGNIIISGSTDRTLRVWDMETGHCVHTLLGHTSTVRCMHLHGNKVVSGSRDATLRVWDIEQGSCLRVLVGHLAAVRCVQYDGKLIVSGAYDYMVKIWHPERSECLHTLQGHTNRVYSLQFDGVHVVSGSLDTSIRVWDVETGNCKHTLMGHQSLTSGMELRENILVSGNADSTVKVWDITTGQCLQTLSGPNKHQSAVTCLQFNSRFVVTSSDDGTVKLWDVKTGEFIRNLVSLDSGGSGGVVWRIRANDTKLICAVGSRNGTEETKLMVLDFDVEGACVKCS